MMRSILRRSSSLVFAGLFLLNGHCDLLSQRVLANPPAVESLKFLGDDERTYSLCYKTQGENSVPWIIGAGQESVAYMCERDDGKNCVVKIRDLSGCYDIDAVVEKLRKSYKPFKVSDEEIDNSTLPGRSRKAQSPRKSKVHPGDSDSSDMFLDISEERKILDSGKKDIPEGSTSISRKSGIIRLNFDDEEDGDEVGSSVDLDNLFDDLEEDDEFYCVSGKGDSSRSSSSFFNGAQESLPSPIDKKKNKAKSSWLSRMEEVDSSDEENVSKTPRKKRCVKCDDESTLGDENKIETPVYGSGEESLPSSSSVMCSKNGSEVSTPVCGSGDEGLSSPDSEMISKGGSPVETSSCASANASPDSGSSSSVTSVGDAVLRSEVVKQLLFMHRGEIPNLVEIESFNPHIEKAYVANLEKYISGEEKATEDQVKTWVGNILDALVGLSALGICHQDIKPDNILLDENGQAILSDLGAMRTLYEATNRRTSVKGYMAPEVWNESLGTVLRDRADVFSLAITTLELLTGSKVTSMDEYKIIMRKILDDKYRMWDGRPLSEGWKIFLWKCLAPTPEKRLTASQAKAVLDNLVVADGLTVDEARDVLGQLATNEQEELVKIKGIFGKLFAGENLTEDDKKALLYSFISSEKLMLIEKEALYDLWFLHSKKLNPEDRKVLLNCSSDEELNSLNEIFKALFFPVQELSSDEKKLLTSPLLKHFVEHKRLMSVMEEKLLKSLFVSKEIARDQVDGLFSELHSSIARSFADLLSTLTLDAVDEQESFEE